VSESYATGSVTSNGVHPYAGGLIGLNEGGSVSASYAAGSVSAADARGDVGGLIGQNQSSSASASYSTGAVMSSSPATGGFVGKDTSPGGIADAYWDTSTSGITNASKGAGKPFKDPGITGLTTTQLQTGLPAGFDPAIWAENPNINGGLPYLIDNPPQ